jgi:hypothetical protein
MSVCRAPLVALVIILAVFPGLTPTSAATDAREAQAGTITQPEGSRFGGTWWMNFGPPPQRPIILTMTASGTFVLQDSLDGGGHLPTGASFSTTQGTWSRTGAQSAKALGLRFVYDASGKTDSVERVRLSLAFAGSFDRLEGLLQLEQMFCVERPSPLPFTVPVCPDPTLAPTQVQRGPAPFTAVRVSIQAPGP